jgi:3-deoxy-D-manno-octulosonic-acid transferase
MGDPRYDSVVERIAGQNEVEPLLRFGRGAPTLVAGSTWPEDEVVLLAAFARVRAAHPTARLVLVPHEPTERHLLSVERAAARLGLPVPLRLSGAEHPVPLLLVDRVGVLARLYGIGSMAYVGGGFGRAGLHSVLEPAAWGLPVSFGPRWGESRDAAALLQAGAARALTAHGSAAVEELVGIWSGWIDGADGAAAAGMLAKSLVERGRGASVRSAELLAGLISSLRPRRSPSAAR